MQYAKSYDLVIVTKDADFYDRIILEGAPPKVIWIRLGNIRRKKLEEQIQAQWHEIQKLLEQYSLIEIHPDSLEGIK